MAKTIMLLGATSGIAEAVARQLGREGYALILAGRDQSRLERLAGDLEVRCGDRPKTAVLDVNDLDSHEEFLNMHCHDLDGVVCAVGYLGDQKKAETDPGELHNVFMTNYCGPAALLSGIANQMERRGQGMIIGISSVAGDRGRATNYAYGSAKAGFTAFLSGLRNRLSSSGVHVMTVKPGFVNTMMTAGMDLPKALTAEPDEVAVRIAAAMKKKKNVVYVKTIWRLIMGIIIHIPERLFKKMSI